MEKRTDVSKGLDLFLHKDIVDAILGCRQVLSRLTSIRLRAVPFKITIIQVFFYFMECMFVCLFSL